MNIEAYCQWMEKRGVQRNVAAPIAWRLLRALGIPVAPQLFWKPRAILVSWVLGVSVAFFCLYRSGDLLADELLEPGYRYFAHGLGWRYWGVGAIFGLILGVIAVTALGRKAKQLKLPSWEECVAEVTAAQRSN